MDLTRPRNFAIIAAPLVFLLPVAFAHAISTGSGVPDRAPDHVVVPGPAARDLGVASYEVFVRPDERHYLAVALRTDRDQSLGVVYFESIGGPIHSYLKASAKPSADPDEGQRQLALLHSVIHDRSLSEALR